MTGRSLQEIVQRLAPLIELLQSGTLTSSAHIMQAIMSGRFGAAQVGDIREPILFGLIGGGMTSTEAGALVRNVFDEAFRTPGRSPILLHAVLAFDISLQALIGWQDDSLGEPTPTPPKARPRRPMKAEATPG